MGNGMDSVPESKRRKLTQGEASKLNASADSDSLGSSSGDEEATAGGVAGDLQGPVLSWFRSHLIVDEHQKELKELCGLDERLLKHLKEDLAGDFIDLFYYRRADCSLHCLGAIIILPTAALASQVFGVAKAVCGCVNLRVEILGSRDVTLETKMLEKGACMDPCVVDGLNSIDILITTPGHLLVHLQETKALTLKHLKFLVVDEADVLMKEGDVFKKLSPYLVSRLRSDKHPNMPMSTFHKVFRPETSMCSRVLKILVSATVTRDPGALSSLDIHHPRLIAPKHKKSRYTLPEGLEEFKVVCPAPLRPLVLVKLLQDFLDERTLVFAQTVETASRLCMMLCEMESFKGIVAEYSAQVSLRERKATLNAFQEKKIRVLVASDAMSRGIDVANIMHVVNYDTPNHVKKYIHRVGRTARAGDGGKAYSLIRKCIDEEAFGSLRSKLGKGVQNVVLNVDELRDIKPQVDSAIERMKSKLSS